MCSPLCWADWVGFTCPYGVREENIEGIFLNKGEWA